MKQKLVFAIFTLALLLALFFFAIHEFSKLNILTVEAEQHWETFGIGGTCIPATHNLCLSDVDDDGTIEIVTGGYTYYLTDSNLTKPAPPLKIWNWDGKKLTLEKSENSTTADSTIIISVFAGNANNDGETEIITAGGTVNATGYYAQLKIWRWNGETLTLKTNYESTSEKISFSSVFVSDLDKDDTPEIITCGRSYGVDNGSKAQLGIWHWNGNSLTIEELVEWRAAKEASANSVYASDVNNDGIIDIITGGYDNDLNNSSGQLRMWHWNGERLSAVANTEWRLKENGYGLTISGGVMGNTLVNNLKISDVDGDGTPEIVTGGFAYDGAKINAQLRIWNCNGTTFTLEKSQEWTTKEISEIKAISLNDVDSDGQMEIVTSGVTAAQGSFAANATDNEFAQLRVWSWNGKTLTLKQSQDWTIGEGVCAWNVGTGDLDKDGTVEIVTVGCMYISNLCDPDMRIWSITKGFSTSTFPFPIEFVVAAVTSTATVALATAYYLRKHRS